MSRITQKAKKTAMDKFGRLSEKCDSRMGSTRSRLHLQSSVNSLSNSRCSSATKYRKPNISSKKVLVEKQYGIDDEIPLSPSIEQTLAYCKFNDLTNKFAFTSEPNNTKQESITLII
jgi:hypothetical protein